MTIACDVSGMGVCRTSIDEQVMMAARRSQ